MNATYIVRPDYIEITTFDRRLEEKVTRVFPVADLVIPIPDSVNQQTLFQNLSSPEPAAGDLRPGARRRQNFQGFGGAFGKQHVGGQFGGPGGGAPTAASQGRVGNSSARPPGSGQPGRSAAAASGVGGGNLGQFGNLGGQFGLQGGDQSQLAHEPDRRDRRPRRVGPGPARRRRDARRRRGRRRPDLAAAGS